MPSPKEGKKLVSSTHPNFQNAITAARRTHGEIKDGSFRSIAEIYFPRPLDPAWTQTSEDIAEFLDRSDINSDIDLTRKTPGRTADIMGLKLQARIMAMAERSLRLRYKPFGLLFTDAQARSSSMLDLNGPIAKVQEYVQNVLDSE